MREYFAVSKHVGFHNHNRMQGPRESLEDFAMELERLGRCVLGELPAATRPRHGLPHQRPVPTTLNRCRDDRRCRGPRRSRRRTPESKPLPEFRVALGKPAAVNLSGRRLTVNTDSPSERVLTPAIPYRRPNNRRTPPARPQSWITGAGPHPCDPAPPLEAKPPPTEQPGARQSLPPRRVEAVLAPLLSPPPLDQSAQQPRDLEIAAAPNASQHLDEKPPPTEQPGARHSLPPSGSRRPKTVPIRLRSYSLPRSGTSPPCPGRVAFRAPPPKKLPDREPLQGKCRPPPSPTGPHRRRLQKERNRT
nr:basic proline-rich protein-like [Drosophila kikkawai]